MSRFVGSVIDSTGISPLLMSWIAMILFPSIITLGNQSNLFVHCRDAALL